MLNSPQRRWDCKRVCSNTRGVNCAVCWSYGDIWTINMYIYIHLHLLILRLRCRVPCSLKTVDALNFARLCKIHFSCENLGLGLRIWTSDTSCKDNWMWLHRSSIQIENLSEEITLVCYCFCCVSERCPKLSLQLTNNPGVCSTVEEWATLMWVHVGLSPICVNDKESIWASSCSLNDVK